MNTLVDLLLESAMMNIEIKSKGISNENYALCLLVQVSNIHLAKLTLEQKKQILIMVQNNLSKRKYSAL